MKVLNELVEFSEGTKIPSSETGALLWIFVSSLNVAKGVGIVDVLELARTFICQKLTPFCDNAQVSFDGGRGESLHLGHERFKGIL